MPSGQLPNRKHGSRLGWSDSKAARGPAATVTMPRMWLKEVRLARPKNVWGSIVVPLKLHGLLERREIAVGGEDSLQKLLPDTSRSYEDLDHEFGRASFVTSLWSMAGAKQLLKWVAPSLPPPGLCMVEQLYQKRSGHGPKWLNVVLLMIESRHQPTVTPEHTDSTPSVLCIITGRKVISLRENKIAPGRVEPRVEIVELKAGDALFIPAGVHHKVASDCNTIAFSIGISSPSNLCRPTMWRRVSRSWRTPPQWSNSAQMWSHYAMKQTAIDLTQSSAPASDHTQHT